MNNWSPRCPQPAVLQCNERMRLYSLILVLQINKSTTERNEAMQPRWNFILQNSFSIIYWKSGIQTRQGVNYCKEVYIQTELLQQTIKGRKKCATCTVWLLLLLLSMDTEMFWLFNTTVWFSLYQHMGRKLSLQMKPKDASAWNHESRLVYSCRRTPGSFHIQLSTSPCM